MPADLQELEAKLGHAFHSPDLLVRALTHSSFAAETKASAAHPDNEQLEFLGDAILGFLVSERLVRLLPAASEGRLSKLKHRLVCADRLHHAARAIELGPFLRLGRGEEIGGGRHKRSLLADAVEAIIAALYLDAGLETAARFVDAFVIGDAGVAELESSMANYKGELDERVNALRLPKPRYAVIEHSGPDHARNFVVEAQVGDRFRSRGSGTTKKSASQDAARAILTQLDGLK
jgi:ribonuclease-3